MYEYVGEVIGPKPFEAKMKAYGNEGIKHFYFMALDRDVFIDATKKGGKGRFLNHSCNPNCYVSGPSARRCAWASSPSAASSSTRSSHSTTTSTATGASMSLAPSSCERSACRRRPSSR